MNALMRIPSIRSDYHPLSTGGGGSRSCKSGSFRNTGGAASLAPSTIMDYAPSEQSSFLDHNGEAREGDYLVPPTLKIDVVNYVSRSRPGSRRAPIVDEPKPKKTIRQRIIKAVKISLPHIGLTSMLLMYILIGGVLFNEIEGGFEKSILKRDNAIMDGMIKNLQNLTWSMRDIPNLEFKSFQSMLFAELNHYAKKSSERLLDSPYVYTRPSKDIYGRDSDGRAWNLRSSILYALTVISSTGYNNVNVETSTGRLFSVAYGLVGIPLMFITAANIGKLLSEMILVCCLRLQQNFCKESQYCVHQKTPSLGLENLEVPAMFILGLILGFCGIGAMIYLAYEPTWTFVQAYHVSFEGMISLVLADIGNNNVDYIVLLLSYKILSLSVLTMCLDLARVKLLRLFRHIHYFGRSFKFGSIYNDYAADGFESAAEAQAAMTDLAVLLLDPRFRNILPEIIEAIYRDDPERADGALNGGRPLTSKDIFEYLRRLGDKQRLLREEMNQAFVPAGFKYWKYADQEKKRRAMRRKITKRGRKNRGGVKNSRAAYSESESVGTIEEDFPSFGSVYTPDAEDDDSTIDSPATPSPPTADILSIEKF